MPAHGADQHRLEVGAPAAQLGGHREGRHQVPAGAPAGDEDGAHAAAASRGGRPRIRPMLTRIPVATSEMTRLERPYDMNGKVSPVVGIRRERHRHVHHGGDADHRRDPGGQELAEGVRRAPRDAEAEPAERCRRAATTSTMPRNPHSSPMVLNRKSE